MKNSLASPPSINLTYPICEYIQPSQKRYEDSIPKIAIPLNPMRGLNEKAETWCHTLNSQSRPSILYKLKYIVYCYN